MPLRPWIILASLSLARVGFGYQYQSVASLGTGIVDRFGLIYAELGNLIGAYNLLGVVIALPVGLLGRRLGDRGVLAAGLALMTLGACISGHASDVSWIGIGRTLAGAGAVAMIVLQSKIVADWFKGARFMIGISVTVCSFPIGMGLAGMILPPVRESFGLGAAFLTGAVPAAIALVLFLGSYRAPPDAVPVLRKFSMPSGRECLLLVIAGSIWMVYTAGYGSFLSYLPASLTVRGYSVTLTGLVMMVATWGNVPATMLGGGLAARFGGFNIFLVGTLCLAGGMTGAALFGWPLLWAVILGVFGSIHPGVVMAVATLSARPEHRTAGMGLFYTLYYLGGSVAPGLCGIAADYAGRPEGGLLAAAALSVLAIPLYMLHRALASHETMLVRA